MVTKTPKKGKAAKGTLVLTRVLDVPRRRAWKAWTDPKDIKRWWGPKDYTAPHIDIDLRVGGKWLYCMRGMGLDGVVRDFWNTGEFLEVVPLEKLVSTVRFSDEHGNPVPASEQGVPGDWPEEIRETVTFEDVEGGRKTKVTIREAGIPGVMTEMASLGWKQSLDKLTRALAG